MKTLNTRNLLTGYEIVVDGKLRKILKKEKAFKAPEYFLIFEMNDGTITRQPFHANKKWMVSA